MKRLNKINENHEPYTHMWYPFIRTIANLDGSKGPAEQK